MTSNQWKCDTCGKAKDLSGSHLAGKTSVRSDCWPCGKKRGFTLVGTGGGAALLTSEKKTSGAPTTTEKPQPTTVGGTAPFLFAGVTQAPGSAAPAVAAVGFAKPATAAPAAAATQPSLFQFSGGKTGNPFLTAAAPPGPLVSAFGPPPPSAASHAPAAAASASSSSSTGIVMQTTNPGSGRTQPSPPFSFVKAGSAPSQAPPVMHLGQASGSAAVPPLHGTGGHTATSTGDEAWKCSVCLKTKDLRGPHLDGKHSVRSDCWPCAKKQTFHRYDASGRNTAMEARQAGPAHAPPASSSKPVIQQAAMQPASAVHSAPAVTNSNHNCNATASQHGTEPHSSASSGGSGVSNGHAAGPPTNAAPLPAFNSFPSSTKSLGVASAAWQLEPTSTTDTLKTSSSFDATPILPFNARRSAFAWREPEVASVTMERQFFLNAALHAHKGALGGSTGRSTPPPAPGETSLSAAFEAMTLQSYIRAIKAEDYAHRLQLVWSEDRTVLYAFYGRCVSASPVPSVAPVPLVETERALGTIGAVLLHLTTVAPKVGRVFCADSLSFAAAAMFQAHVNRELEVFGPAHDKTTQPTLLDDIVEALKGSARVTSGDQRNHAVRQLWTGLGLSVMPSAATGETIRATELAAPAVGTVDLVLIPRCATAEESSQFKMLIS